MLAACEGGFLDATALAEYLVDKKVPFRQAHQVVGQLVAQAEKQNLELRNLPLEQLKAAIARHRQGRLRLARREERRQPVRQQGLSGKKTFGNELKKWSRSLQKVLSSAVDLNGGDCPYRLQFRPQKRR